VGKTARRKKGERGGGGKFLPSVARARKREIVSEWVHFLLQQPPAVQPLPDRLQSRVFPNTQSEPAIVIAAKKDDLLPTLSSSHGRVRERVKVEAKKKVTVRRQRNILSTATGWGHNGSTLHRNPTLFSLFGRVRER
jgi:hypothetical protein